MNNLAPWLQPVLQQLTQQAHNKTNPVLLVGHDANALIQVVFDFLANALCEQPKQKQACGSCHSCQLLASHNHPDVYPLFPQKELVEHDLHATVKSGKKPGETILIEEVRQCQNFFHTASSRSGSRYVVIYPFDALNSASANALLKILEEPSDHLGFILVGQQIESLPPTIVSRCQKVTVQSPDFDTQVGWLKQKGVEKPEQLLSLSLLNAYEALKLQYAKDMMQLRLSWVQWLVSSDPYLVPVNQLEKLDLKTLFELALRVCYDFQCILEGHKPAQFPWLSSSMAWACELDRNQLNQVYYRLQTENKFASHPLNSRLVIDFIVENWRLLKH